MPTIREVTPYAIDGNLARAYNDEMERAKPGEYVMFTDRDVLWLDPHYMKHIHSIIEEHGEAFYTCLTNRVNTLWQRVFGLLGYEDDVKAHYETMLELHSRGNKVIDHTDSQLWSGFVMVVPKDRWIPLEEKKVLLGIDNQIHLMARRQGCRVLLMTGVYVYHIYSFFDGDGGHSKRDKSHLKID